jgi:hypothetical protein
MEIYIHVRKEVTGRSITVSVLAFSGQLINSVSVSLDDSLLGDCTLAFPQVSYMRTWHWAGGGAPDGSHRVVVTATDQKGRGEMASKK